MEELLFVVADGNEVDENLKGPRGASPRRLAASLADRPEVDFLADDARRGTGAAGRQKGRSHRTAPAPAGQDRAVVPGESKPQPTNPNPDNPDNPNSRKHETAVRGLTPGLASPPGPRTGHSR